jgi:hypothetical protein
VTLFFDDPNFDGQWPQSVGTADSVGPGPS